MVQAFQFRKHDFDLWVGGDGLGMYQQLEGGFRLHARNTAHVRPRSKKGSKLYKNEIALSYFHHSIRLNELIILMWSDVKIG